MKSKLAALILIIACAAAAPALAAEPDISTPQGAQKAAVAAMRKEDQATVRKFLDATTPMERKIADSIAANAVAGAKAYNAAVAKFGEETAKKELGGIVPVQPSDSELEKTQWKIEGDKATPLETDPQSPTPGAALHKVGGTWKMSVSDITTGHSDDELTRSVALVDRQTAIMNETAKEASEGKYKTVDDMKSASMDKMRKMIMEMQAAAATEPATGPATAPARMR